MLLEVSKALLSWAVILGLVCGVVYFKYHTTTLDRSHLAKWVNANIRCAINPEGTIQVLSKHGTYPMKLKYYVNNPTIKTTIAPVVSAAWTSLKVGIYTIAAFLLLCCLWFVRRGRRISQTKLIKGAYVVPAKELKSHIQKTGKTSDLTLAGVPLYENIECQHIFIHGSTGTGKSQIISELLDGIKERGDKAIIYDKHGSFVSHYYKETDILLNPLDERGQAWHPWAEAKSAADFDMISASLMPHPPGQNDPFWINAARSIFAATAYKMTNDKDKSLAKLLQYIFSDDLTELSTLLAGTEAASLVSDKAEKTALSVKSVLATYLNMLKYVKHDDNPFSIKQWVTQPHDNSWLFISSRADKHESLKPIMSLWLDIAANALLSAGEDPKRRLWLIVDELPSLQRLPYLPAFMAEGRKFGGCFVGGVQNYFQLQKIYGPDGAKEIVDLCNTRVFFRAPSHDSARWVSQELGDSELVETREGISYGANNVRDGVSINQQRIVKPAVSISDINKLKDLQGYIAIPPLGKGLKTKTDDDNFTWPIGQFQLTYRKREVIAKGFIEVSQEPVSKEDEKEVPNNDVTQSAQVQKAPETTSQASTVSHDVVPANSAAKEDAISKADSSAKVNGASIDDEATGTKTPSPDEVSPDSDKSHHASPIDEPKDAQNAPSLAEVSTTPSSIMQDAHEDDVKPFWEQR